MIGQQQKGVTVKPWEIQFSASLSVEIPQSTITTKKGDKTYDCKNIIRNMCEQR